MDFDLSETQKMLAAETRKLLHAQASPARLRQIIDSDAGWDERLWRALADLGLQGVAIAETHGGVGLTEIDLCVICEELGRAPAPVPFLSSIGQAAEAIRLAGSSAQQQAWLPRLATGEVIAVYADNDARHPAVLRDGCLTAVKSPVADAHLAKLAIVSATESNLPGLYLVPLVQPAITATGLQGFDQLRLHGTLGFENAACERLPGADAAFIDAMRNRSAIYTAFEQIGGAEACLFMARDYALQRHAFGRAVASYQSIKHKLADMLLEIELARSNAYYAAWALATDAPDLPQAAAIARLSASSAYDLAARENLHVHGGFGYTWEADCHFHYHRARLLAASLGAPDQWAQRLIAAMQPPRRTAA